MKKIVIALLLISLLSVTACAPKENDKPADESTGESVSGGVTEDAVGTGTANVIPDDSEANADDPNKGLVNVFGNIYIPELPFSDWEGGNQDNISCYTLYIKSNNHDAFHTYAQSLTDFGYTVKKTKSFSYAATDPVGRRLYLTDHENGQMQIAIYYN